MIMLDGFTGSGIVTYAAQELGIKTIGFLETDKFANAVLTYHFPEIKNYGDIRTFSRRKYKGRFDLFSFGFPCTDISIAGKGAGLRGQQSGLFYEAYRIVKQFRPTYFIFENVKNLIGQRHILDFAKIVAWFTYLGYDCQWQLINTLWFLPQDRERVFFVGNLRSAARPKIFPITEDEKIFRGTTQPEGTQPQAPVSALRKRYGSKPDNTFVVDMNLSIHKHSTTIEANYSKGPDGQFGSRPILAISHTDRGRKFHTSKHSNTITAHMSNGRSSPALLDKEIRRFTPLECERLQGFPDNWTEHGINVRGKTITISDTQRYNIIGNGISKPVISLILRKLIETV